MTADELVHAINCLAACDHFDESRRAAHQLPDTLPLITLLRAADGATQLARHLNTARRTTT